MQQFMYRETTMRCTIIPVAIGATEATVAATKALKKNLETIPGKHSMHHNKRQLYLEHDT
jgi:hypothetical protein